MQEVNKEDFVLVQSKIKVNITIQRIKNDNVKTPKSLRT